MCRPKAGLCLPRPSPPTAAQRGDRQTRCPDGHRPLREACLSSRNGGSLRRGPFDLGSLTSSSQPKNQRGGEGTAAPHRMNCAEVYSPSCHALQMRIER